MCFPPLVWQTYDIQFTAPRWAADGSKVRDAQITSWINGVKVQDNVSLPNKTGAGQIEEPTLLPIRLQNHGDPVRFRNIWVLDRDLTNVKEFPVMAPKEAAQEPTKSAEKPQAKNSEKKKPLKADAKKPESSEEPADS